MFTHRPNQCVLLVLLQLEEQNAALDQQRLVLVDRDARIVSLDGKVDKLEDETSQLRHELEEKGHEVLAVRREGNTELRRLESRLTKEHERHMSLLSHDCSEKISYHRSQFAQDKMAMHRQIAELQSR